MIRLFASDMDGTLLSSSEPSPDILLIPSADYRLVE